MANLHDYYFRQRVTEQELDEGFEQLEAADFAQAVDYNLVGITTGLGAAEDSGGASLDIEIGTGTAYSKDGERMRVVGTQTIDVSVDENAASTEPAVGGNSLVITIFLNFIRVLSDPRTDGNAATVFFNRFESFEFVVRIGGEAVTPGGGAEVAFINTNGVANDASMIRVCDIIRANGDATMANANIFTSRREDAFVYTAGAFTINAGTPELSDLALLQEISNIATGVTSTLFDGTNLPIPAAWTALAAATTMQDAVDAVTTDLAQTDGGSLVGFDNSTASLPGAPTDMQAAWNDFMTSAPTVVMGASTYNMTGDLDIDGAITAVQEISGVGRVTFDTGSQQRTGSGTPEAAIAAPVGSTFHRDDGGAGTSFYVKESGVGNTGWVAK